MRLIAIIILFSFIFGCVKKQSSDPVPTIEYKNFSASTNGVKDTSVLVIGYEDGDGDIFRDKPSDFPNLISTIYVYDNILNKFNAVIDVLTKDTVRYSQTITQPEASYKGKQVKGDIYWPSNEFRPNSQTKIFYYKLFMVYMKNHKSNEITTPTYTVN